MAVDYFLKFPGILGESKSSKHPGEIDVISWHWGALDDPGEPGGREIEAFTFVHSLDMASPKLLTALANGTNLGEATLTVELQASPPLDYATYRMADSLVTAVHPSAEGTRKPIEEVSLAFTHLLVTYRPLKPSGGLGSSITGSISSIAG